ncbi:Low copy number virion structural protein [Brevibacillus laterosporus]|uniref:Low copy number virion structural protein n=1 Tax=Brevibacillus laterosporus TaxID=1465 RepID=UPI0018CE3650|nr:Low copy number virion structural protein [Brevibacillus laterosporus]MBG9790489.1 Low copy number virion structural protein [Brevibacillus laterosporus]
MSGASNFASYIVGGRLDPPFMPTKTNPFIEGIMVESMGIGKTVKQYTVAEDAELLAVSVGTSFYEPKDHWNLHVGNHTICRNIYTKDLPEGMYLTAIIPTPKDTLIQFEYFNEGGTNKYVWVNYQMLK